MHVSMLSTLTSGKGGERANARWTRSSGLLAPEDFRTRIERREQESDERKPPSDPRGAIGRRGEKVYEEKSRAAGLWVSSAHELSRVSGESSELELMISMSAEKIVGLVKTERIDRRDIDKLSDADGSVVNDC
ncbi:hypothetical protein AXG93_2960s1460 [Marchantia polymorpha subsp. ruderalis]|uniref:Uncharacterized protein n=1 Tax=Marchantia polymorpha subsp. ruderalis TaxID=1480154 RepID=A0A176W7D5_MARPO|nr:hypothetical protein AXG93_2960s1460 [Marchantia polymorpha subsp. ruderalis]